MHLRANAASRQRPLPLVITTDALILDDLVRLAAAGGSAVQVAPDARAAGPHWHSAPFVIIGSDALASCIHARLRPRPSVLVVALSTIEPLPWVIVEALGAEQVAVLPAAEADLVDRFAEQAGGVLARGTVMAVIGTGGSAGSAVLGTALGVCAARQGLDALLVDADRLACGIDLTLGWSRLAGHCWSERVDGRGRLHPPGLLGDHAGPGSLGLATVGESLVDGVPVDAIAGVLEAGQRTRDAIVVMLPRRLDDGSLLALSVADHAYLVAPAEVTSPASVRRLVSQARTQCPDFRLVVRCRSAADAIELAEALDLPLAGMLRPDPSVELGLAAGDPPAIDDRGPLAALCRDLLSEVAPRSRRAGAR